MPILGAFPCSLSLFIFPTNFYRHPPVKICYLLNAFFSNLSTSFSIHPSSKGLFNPASTITLVKKSRAERLQSFIVILPCFPKVFIHHNLELHRTHACKTVINIIERAAKNVRLFLPEAALPKERIFFVIHVRTVNFFQSCPDCLAFCRCHLRFFVHNVLELVHHTSVWDKRSGIFQMHFQVIVFPVSEE